MKRLDFEFSKFEKFYASFKWGGNFEVSQKNIFGFFGLDLLIFEFKYCFLTNLDRRKCDFSIFKPNFEIFLSFIFQTNFRQSTQKFVLKLGKSIVGSSKIL